MNIFKLPEILLIRWDVCAQFIVVWMCYLMHTLLSAKLYERLKIIFDYLACPFPVMSHDDFAKCNCLEFFLCRANLFVFLDAGTLLAALCSISGVCSPDSLLEKKKRQKKPKLIISLPADSNFSLLAILLQWKEHTCSSHCQGESQSQAKMLGEKRSY